MDIEKLKFPIGKYVVPEEITTEQLRGWIDEISALPASLRTVTAGLTNEQLNTPYRPQGWTVRQVIHHLADSHMNSYIRFKLAVTEENPTIRPYFEERWAECEDAKNGDIELSLKLIEALHNRWSNFLGSLSLNEWDKTFFHPENQRTIPLKEVAGLYAWHGKHHLNHILNALKV
ncbi:MAG: putative metal-dependent hydrolase [Sphingobacteriaceae bacterium]|nr:putative metal-dependent hydrolase [Sphingobacteriaceae bacterium]